jgi:multimeric flavodoxin WrbA
MLEAIDVHCGKCRAKPGHKCVTKSGEPTEVPHKIREADARWRTHEMK